MHRHMLVAAVAFSLAGCGSPTPTENLDQSILEAVNGPILLTALQPGDILTVDLESSGCFHEWTADLRFEYGSEGHVTVEATATPTIHPLRGRTVITTGRSEAQLVPAATLRGLDQVLTRLRGPQEGYCTTQSEYRFALYRNGLLVAEEYLRDKECGGYPNEDPASFFPMVSPALDHAYELAGLGTSGA